MFTPLRYSTSNNFTLGLIRKENYPLEKLRVFYDSVLLFYRHHETTGDIICPGNVRGIDHIRDPRLNKGLAFSHEERQALGIHGLLAAKVSTQKEQLDFCNLSFDRYKGDLNKYLYLMELQDTNEKLFFSLLDQDIEKFLPVVYTPTVGLACQTFGLMYRRTRGLFITVNDKGHVYDILRNWPENDVRAIVFTDGERILGLGDLGSYGMGIPVGKLALYTALGGIRPHQCLPITLDVGTNNKTLLEDPLYIGLRQQRVSGPEYDEFVDEFMNACVRRYGPNVILQFEDFALPNAGRLLEKYKDSFCTFNDDIQGTASVALAGLLASTRVTKKKLSEYVIMFLGAGSASTGIAKLIVDAMVEENTSLEEAYSRIYLFDIDGLLSNKRPGGVPPHAKDFGKDMEPEKDFLKCVKDTKASTLIGCSTVGGAFTPEILKQVAENTERPVIFALSNPTNRAECTAQAAYDHTQGRCIFASGSPFPPVTYNGKVYHTGQGNNSYIFPGVALGVIASRAHRIPNYVFLEAAKSLARIVKEKHIEEGRLYPPLAEVKDVSFHIAMDVVKLAYDKGLATHYPKPDDFSKLIKTQIYNLNYDSYLPKIYKFPDLPKIQVKSIEEAYRGMTTPEKRPNP